MKTERKKNCRAISEFGKSLWGLRFVRNSTNPTEKEKGAPALPKRMPLHFIVLQEVKPLLLFQPLGGKKIEDDQRDTTGHEHACKIN